MVNYNSEHQANTIVDPLATARAWREKYVTAPLARFRGEEYVRQRPIP